MKHYFVLFSNKRTSYKLMCIPVVKNRKSMFEASSTPKLEHPTTSYGTHAKKKFPVTSTNNVNKG